MVSLGAMLVSAASPFLNQKNVTVSRQSINYSLSPCHVSQVMKN